MMPIRMMYSSMGATSKLLLKERIRMPMPAEAPVDSAAIRVVRATETPRRTAVRMKGVVAGNTTLMNRSLSLAPSTRAAFSSVSSTLRTP